MGKYADDEYQYVLVVRPKGTSEQHVCAECDDLIDLHYYLNKADWREEDITELMECGHVVLQNGSLIRLLETTRVSSPEG